MKIIKPPRKRRLDDPASREPGSLSNTKPSRASRKSSEKTPNETTFDELSLLELKAGRLDEFLDKHKNNSNKKALLGNAGQTKSLKNQSHRPHTKASRPQDHRVQAYNKAIRLLARREHSVKEIRQKIATEFLDDVVLDTLVEQLQSENYLSDHRFTEAFVRSRKHRGVGPVKLRAELNNKGVDSELAESMIDASSKEWLEVALKLHDKKYGDQAVSDYNQWTKRARFLQSRGFTMDHIKNVIPNVDYD